MKKVLFFLAALLTLSVAFIAPVQALIPVSYVQELQPPFVFIGVGATGRALILAPGHPPYAIYEAIDLEHSTFGHPHDALFISFSGILIVVTDNPEFAEMMEEMFARISPYISIVQVGPRDLEVCSSCGRVTAVLSVPVEGLTPYGYLTIPPFIMEFIGEGPGEWTEETSPMPSGDTVHSTMMNYEATATITAPDGSVWPALAAILGQDMTMIVTSLRYSPSLRRLPPDAPFDD